MDQTENIKRNLEEQAKENIKAGIINRLGTYDEATFECFWEFHIAFVRMVLKRYSEHQND